jgi:hypothetical protein
MPDNVVEVDVNDEYIVDVEVKTGVELRVLPDGRIFMHGAIVVERKLYPFSVQVSEDSLRKFSDRLTSIQ